MVGGVSEEQHAYHCASECDTCDIGLRGGRGVGNRIDLAQHRIDWSDDLHLEISIRFQVTLVSLRVCCLGFAAIGSCCVGVVRC